MFEFATGLAFGGFGAGAEFDKLRDLLRLLGQRGAHEAPDLTAQARLDFASQGFAKLLSQQGDQALEFVVVARG